MLHFALYLTCLFQFYSLLTAFIDVLLLCMKVTHKQYLTYSPPFQCLYPFSTGRIHFFYNKKVTCIFSFPRVQGYAWNSWEIFEPSLKLNLHIYLNSSSVRFLWIRSLVSMCEMELHVSRVPSSTGYNYRQAWVGILKCLFFCFDLLFRYPTR